MNSLHFSISRRWIRNKSILGPYGFYHYHP